MAPGKRHKDRLNWPANLHFYKREKGLYYYYLRPDLPRGHEDRYNGLGYITFAQAVDAAKQLNQALSPGGEIVAKVLAKSVSRRKDSISIGQYADIMLAQKLPERRIQGHRLSERTMEEYTRLYANIKAKIGDRSLVTTTQAEIAEALAMLGTTAETFNKYRTRLIDLYANAVSDGYIPDNLPLRILPRDKEIKKRQRITLPGDKPGTYGIDGLEAYNAIFAKAPRAIQCAMELTLNALQRREEIHSWQFKWSDQGHVYVRISKTHKHGVASYVRIPEELPVAYSAIGARTLGDIIKHCRADGIMCPFVVHQRPIRAKRSTERDHPFQLTPSQISRGFAEARDAAGIYNHLAQDEKPTFHELIALGEHLREKQGWTAEQIQKLRGHSKVSTTKIYLEGHEWTTVEFPGKTG